MVVMSRKKFILSFILIYLGTLFLIIAGVRGQEGPAAQDLIDTQNILFWGIVVSLAQLGAGLFLWRSQRRLMGDLGRLARIGDLSHHQSRRILGRMGELGEGLERLMAEQDNVVVLRSNRISALNTLVRMLCDGYEDPIIITDITGTVLNISDALESKLKKENGEALGNSLKDLRPDINLPEVLSYLEKQKLPWSSPEAEGVVCVPVFDKTNTLNFCLWELETEHFVKQYREKQAVIRKQKTQAAKKRLLSRIRKKP